MYFDRHVNDVCEAVADFMDAVAQEHHPAASWFSPRLSSEIESDLLTKTKWADLLQRNAKLEKQLAEERARGDRLAHRLFVAKAKNANEVIKQVFERWDWERKEQASLQDTISVWRSRALKAEHTLCDVLREIRNKVCLYPEGALLRILEMIRAALPAEYGEGKTTS